MLKVDLLEQTCCALTSPGVQSSEVSFSLVRQISAFYMFSITTYPTDSTPTNRNETLSTCKDRSTCSSTSSLAVWSNLCSAISRITNRKLKQVRKFIM